MVARTQRELDLIQQFSGVRYEEVLKVIPENDRKWKCFTCSTILKNSDLKEKGVCPVCNDKYIQPMCPIDHNHCSHSVIDRIEYCPICGKGICPECGDHSVVQISRVTGYLQDVAGFNAAKKQEVKDRVRVTLQPNGEMVQTNQLA